jgi:NADP-dependent 3-hydroxy acid dehydrogenase YdfG
MSEPVCLILGVGPGNGAALARAFDGAGYRLGLVARSTAEVEALSASLRDAVARSADVRDPEAVTATVAEFVERFGRIDVLIYNAGAGAFADVDAATVEQLESAWRTNVLGLFAAAKALLPGFRKQGSGTVVVIGATAALRGGPQFLPFAQAKAAQRSVAQSLARRLGPEGIHVAYVVLDGVVDLPRTRAAMPERPDTFFLSPAAIADAVLALTRQSPQAWTFELDLRPFGERW